MTDAPAIALDLPDPVRQRLLGLTRETPRRLAGIGVSEDAIRHWCEAFEDGNPLYLEAGAAQLHGHVGPVAPLGAVLSTFVLPYRWPWPPAPGEVPERNLHHDVKEILGYRSASIGKVTVEQLAELQVGDQIEVSQRLGSVSGIKRTTLGEGRFWVIERRYYRSGGGLAVCEAMTSFGYDLQPSSGENTRRSANDAIEVALGGAAPSAGPKREPGLVWDSIEVGQELPPLRLPITPLRSAYVASATRDFAPVHVDAEYARSIARAADAFMSREFHIGMISRCLTDWAGSRVRVRRIELTLRQNLCVGDEMTVTGKVVAKRQSEGRAELDLEVEIHSTRGISSTAAVTIEQIS